MFCPQCGSNQSDELKFCKTCGANLFAVRQAVAMRGVDDKFDWSKTWVAEMFLSESERKRRQAELERERGVTPQTKRYTEIKAGVITACVGVGLMIFLAVFMEGIILGGKVPEDTVEILRRIWIAGVIPLFVGLGLLINGLFVSKKQVEAALLLEQRTAAGPSALAEGTQRQVLQSADTAEFIPPGFSVTEGTTKHLRSSVPKSQNPENT